MRTKHMSCAWPHPATDRRSGFTLMELLVGMTIVITVGIVAFAFANSTITTSGFLSRRTFAQQDGRRVLEAFSLEFRKAALSAVGSYPIEAASSTSVVFYADIDRDGLVERVRYFVDGPTLKKGVLRPSGALPTYDLAAEKVKAMVPFIANPQVFRYYDSTYTGTEAPLPDPADPQKVRYVAMQLVIDENLAVPPEALVLSTTVALRNLKDNL
ncbi:prepilin-type N-terminal cleavage/methylation domain-containing protein [Candidatus Parcubacteria bacterium]|nr:prepilin-type N-terminal cleavage/methylation domain-containing protein [Candidatus Parcubacteria bacterium]